MDANLRRSIILDNYQNPINRGLIDEEGYIKVNANNESCIDELNFIIKIKDNIIEDIRFDGEACAIAISAASVMIKTLIHKTVDEGLNIINNYENMINEKNYDSKILGEANAYDEIYKQPNRKKCALLSWSNLKNALEQFKKNN